MNFLYKLSDWISFKLFGRWFKVQITDPEEIARIKEEFGIDLPPTDWVQPKGKP